MKNKYVKTFESFINENKKDSIDLTKLQQYVEEFRKGIEESWEWNDYKECFKGQCHHIAEDLETYLTELGYNAERVRGYYTDAEDDFEPNTENWEWQDIESYGKKWRRNGETANGLKFPHYWVEVGKYIIDVTEDQFHPSDPDGYRIGIHKRPISYYKKG